jgi:glucose uptake protein GlcU
LWIGYVALFITVILFGSNWAPIKKFETGDGIFFLWMSTNGVLPVGVLIHVWCAYTESQGDPFAGVSAPPLYPLVMVSGLLWVLGNVPLNINVRCLGLGIALLLWSTSSMLVGWAADRFGWFGTEHHIPNNRVLNYLSVALAVFRVFLFAFVRPAEEPEDERQYLLRDDTANNMSVNAGRASAQSRDSNISPMADSGGDASPGTGAAPTYAAIRLSSPSDAPARSPGAPGSWLDRLSLTQRRILGVVLSSLSGVLFGLMFVPVSYIQQNVKGSSQQWLDYVFAQYLGIWIGGTVYFAAYCLYKRNLPAIYPRVAFPAMISGAMWAIAQAGFFVANGALSPAVTFPIATSMPGVVAAVLSVFVFGEIKGMQNYILVTAGIIVTVTGSILGGLSKL